MLVAFRLDLVSWEVVMIVGLAAWWATLEGWRAWCFSQGVEAAARAGWRPPRPVRRRASPSSSSDAPH